MPRSLRVRSIAAFLLFLCSLAAAIPAYARVDPPHPPLDPHHVDGAAAGGSIDLSSTWLMQQGDDPGYADPEFKDGRWIVVSSRRPLNDYGLENVSALWYRTHIQLPPGRRNLSLLLRNFVGDEQFFFNGHLLGSFGHFAGSSRSFNNVSDVLLAIPDTAVRSGDNTIAIRARIDNAIQFGPVRGAITNDTLLLLGDRSTLADTRSLRNFRNYTSNCTNLALGTLLGLIALSLALTLRSEPEYMALCIYTGVMVLGASINFWRDVTNTPNSPFFLLAGGICSAIYLVAMIEFVRIVLSLRRTGLLVLYEWLLAFVCIVVFQSINIGLLLHPAGYSSGFIVACNIFAGVVMLPVNMGLPLLAIWTWWKRRNPDALLLFFPLMLQDILSYTTTIYAILSLLHITAHGFENLPPIQSLYVGWGEIIDFVATITLLLFVVLRTLRIARAKAAAAAEIAAAQTVQQVLLARASQPTPGFDVQSVYRPASEVGGDFFLVSPAPDGSLVAIVGDVSGKGLIAAMRVSMILGVLRREDARDPAAILRGLNEALLMPVTDSTSAPGFTTACCVRLERSGHYSIANAGHIAPYIDGEEIPTEPALPLGLAGDQDYAVTEGLLRAGKQLVLMSDGVVEARSASGELYGFDRVALLTVKPAEQIAEAAVKFGQDDDITVLTIACCA